MRPLTPAGPVVRERRRTSGPCGGGPLTFLQGSACFHRTVRSKVFAFPFKKRRKSVVLCSRSSGDSSRVAFP